jgi:hypothetical protein
MAEKIFLSLGFLVFGIIWPIFIIKKAIKAKRVYSTNFPKEEDYVSD